MYQATKIEPLPEKGDGWFMVEIETPSGHVSRYHHWAQSRDEMEVRVQGTVDRLNTDYMQMAKATKASKAGWMRQNDEARNVVFSDKGVELRHKKRESYKRKLRAYFAENQAVRNKEGKANDERGRGTL